MERVREEVEQERVREGVRNSEGRLRGECRRRRPKAQGLRKSVGGPTEEGNMRVCIYGVCVLYSSSTNNKTKKEERIGGVRERERERGRRPQLWKGFQRGDMPDFNRQFYFSLLHLTRSQRFSLSLCNCFFLLFILPCPVSTSHLFHCLFPPNIPVMEFTFFFCGVFQICCFTFACGVCC